jgi:hypothetical protein
VPNVGRKDFHHELERLKKSLLDEMQVLVSFIQIRAPIALGGVMD